MLIVVSAPSGAGKTTLCREIRKRVPDLAYSVSFTTRNPRPGELQGQAYHFVSEPVFQQMVDRGRARGVGPRARPPLRHAPRGRSRACSTRARTSCSTSTRREPAQLRARYPEGLYVFVVAPSMQELEARLRERKSDAPREIARRLARALDEIAAWREYDYLIVNRHLDEALRQLACIIEAERCRTSRLTLSLPDLPVGGGVQATLPGGAA